MRIESKIDGAWLRRQVAALSSIHRPSASDGERRAAEWIAGRLSGYGLESQIDVERVHGDYWSPLALMTGAAAAAGVLSLRGRRVLGALAGSAAAAAVWDDLSAGRRWVRRRLPQRSTYNVVALSGPPDAEHTIVLVAHHDAAHSGLIFHPGIPAFAWKHLPQLIENNDTSPPLMFPVFAGPALVGAGSALGARALTWLGTILCAGAVPVFADIGMREAVPGANDNVTGVVALLALAAALQERPTESVRVMLVSTGSEESILEGMQAFGRRHFPSLPRDRTFFLCVDTVGSPHLTSLRGEGMMKMRDYTPAAVALIDGIAEELGVWLFPNLRLRNATDGFVALRSGYTSACLGSVTEYKAPANYHWPSDTAANVDYDTLADAVRICEAVVRRLDERWL
jgi:hypothetical protein